MCNYLTNFIRSGDPNGPDADGTPMPQWRPMRADEPNAMFLRESGCECRIDTPNRITDILVDGAIRQL